MGKLWAPLFVPHRLSGQVLDRLLPCLVGLNVDYLRENPRTPMLYNAGVYYVRDLPGQEKWLTIPIVLQQGFADCKSLASWRAAELRVRGEDAHAIWVGRRTAKGLLYHVRVQRGNGLFEDPSAILGMGMNAAGSRHSIVNGDRA